jgi:hypothetical protein
MLNINAQKTWVPWPEAGARLLLSPLTLPLRKKLITEATVQEQDPENPKSKKLRVRVDAEKFDALVAEHCIHGWEGIVSQVGEDGPIETLAYSKEAAPALLRIEPANVFIYTKIQGLDLFLVKEMKAAGNA